MALDPLSKEFGELLGQLSQSEDMASLKGILDILVQGEHYELCAIVNEKINKFIAASN